MLLLYWPVPIIVFEQSWDFRQLQLSKGVLGLALLILLGGSGVFAWIRIRTVKK